MSHDSLPPAVTNAVREAGAALQKAEGMALDAAAFVGGELVTSAKTGAGEAFAAGKNWVRKMADAAMQER